MATIYEKRYNYHPEDFKSYDTKRIREEFLVEKLMDPGNIRLVYSLIERYIVGGAVPLEGGLTLETIEPLKAEYKDATDNPAFPTKLVTKTILL